MEKPTRSSRTGRTMATRTSIRPRLLASHAMRCVASLCSFASLTFCCSLRFWLRSFVRSCAICFLVRRFARPPRLGKSGFAPGTFTALSPWGAAAAHVAPAVGVSFADAAAADTAAWRRAEAAEESSAAKPTLDSSASASVALFNAWRPRSPARRCCIAAFAARAC